MKTQHLILFALMLFFACQKEEDTLPPGPPVQENELTTISSTKTALSAANNSDNLITGITNRLIDSIPYYEVALEEENRLLFKAALVDSIIVVEQDWSAQFFFSDSSEQIAGHLGILQIDSASIRPNPYGNAPLTALISVDMPVRGKFSITVRGKGPEGLAITHDFEQLERIQELPILGLYADYENEVELIFKNATGKERASTLIQLPTDPVMIPSEVAIIKNELPAGDQNLYFLTGLNAGMDLQGEVRWYYTGDAFYVYRKTKNGHLIVSGDQGRTHYHSPHFYEVTMLGEIIKKYDVPNLLHHDIIELPSGNFLVATNSTFYNGDRDDGNREEDMIIEIDRQTGDITKSWDLNQILDNKRPYPRSNSDTDDWLHLNSLFYDATDNSILLSGKHQCVVAKIDYDTGELIWILAHPAGWESPQKEALLQPVDAMGIPIDLNTMDFLPYYQHNPSILPNGNLWVYDNGNYRGYFDDPFSPWESYTRAAEYKINAAEKTVELVWTYSYSPTIFTAATGDVDFNPENGHRLIGFMQGSQISPKIMEFNEHKEVILDVNLNVGKYYYRFEKMTLY